MTVARDNKSTH